MISIIERVRERVQKGARTFMIKVKAHRGEPLNEKADTQAENARQLQDDCRQWTVHTPSMTYEWSDSNGVMSNERWGRECMLQLQEDENWNKPTATTVEAEFLLRGGESGKWLHRIGTRASLKCELCRREREARGASVDSLPQETVTHIQSVGCNLQKKSVIGAHNLCWRYLIGVISIHGEACTKRIEVLKSWGVTKTGNCTHFGRRRTLVRYYHGMT